MYKRQLLHSPTYIGFTGTLENNGRKIILSDLKQDENGVWRMDYEDMDKKIKENHIHFAIFCSPHNHTGLSLIHISRVRRGLSSGRICLS